MGTAVVKDKFTDDDYHAFNGRMELQLTQLREQLNQPAFHRKLFSVGAELELYLIDDEGLPSPVNQEILDAANNPQFTPELNRYNLEMNMSPVALPGAPFKALHDEINAFFGDLRRHAAAFNTDLIPIGTLPTLRTEHFDPSYMTDKPRFHALARGLASEEGGRYRININGKDSFLMEGEGIAAEGANTSFQVHLRLPADHFAHCFNAAQLMTPLVLSLAANSPLLSGYRLWQETRVALFKQSVDFRNARGQNWRYPSRVNFGQGWVRQGAWELFAENVALFPAILPVIYEDDDTSQQNPPPLSELCLHNGTVWSWNRAVYSNADDGHVRIEFRALPAGPTTIDMVANAAFIIGLTLGTQEFANELMTGLPFRLAEYNFYRSAQDGINAKLLWPSHHMGGIIERPVVELIEQFLPLAREGLDILGGDKDDSDACMKVIEERLAKRTNGARWQLERYEHYRQHCSVEESSARLLRDYVENFKTGKPVAEWAKD
ncbi:MAG: hypothetical protein OYH77_08405 [Pseudomonadota bacterium]|nr:hypothetical protein [Pseudomonadota bacterium]